MAKKFKRGKTKEAKAKKLRNVQRPSKPNYAPLSPVRAFLTVVAKAIQAAPMMLQHFDGVGRYTLALTETDATLECWVGAKSVYRHVLPLAQMKPEYVARIETLRTVMASASTVAKPTEKPPRPDGQVKRLKVGNETAIDRAANANFRQSRYAQVHVQSRKASDDMSMGRKPGHIGDLK